MRKYSVRLIIIILAFVVLSGCNSRSSSDTKITYGKLIGTVINSSTKNVVENVSLRLNGKTEEVKNGTFYISDLAPSLYSIEANADGFEPFKQDVAVDGQETEINIELVPLQHANTETSIETPAESPSADVQVNTEVPATAPISDEQPGLESSTSIPEEPATQTEQSGTGAPDGSATPINQGTVDSTLPSVEQEQVTIEQFPELTNPFSAEEISMADGLVTSLKNLGVQVPNWVQRRSEAILLARLVNAEAGGEPYNGKVAVAATVLTRLKSPYYPDTVKDIVFQIVDGKYYQYSPYLDGRINLPATLISMTAVQDALMGIDPSNNADGFYNPLKTTNQWVRSQPVTAVIGGHVFFRSTPL